MRQVTPFYTKLAHILISIICLFYLAIIGETVLAPLLFGLLFALLLLPFANFLEHKCKIPRSVSSILVLLTLIIVISGTFVLLLSQLSELTNDLPAFKNQILVASTEIQTWIYNTFHINSKDQMGYLDTATSELLSKGTGLLGTTLLSVSSIILFLVFIFLYTFFILLHRRLLLKFVVSLFKDEHAVVVHDVVAQIQYIVKKYITGIFLQMLIVSTLACIAFEIIGIKYAFLLGIITGTFNVIPYIGILTALLIALLITFATMGSTDVFFVLISGIVIHIIDGNYIMPKIVGSKVKINTLVALLGLVVGEMVWGIKGMFLSIPVIAIVKVIFDRVDGLKSWGMVLGEEHEPEAVPVTPEELKEDQS
jgi:predicted PurR-regulated permease PerM